MKKFFLSFIFLLICSHSKGQGGANVYAGLASLSNTNKTLTESSQFHSGFSIGIHARLKDDKFVAGPGVKYTRFTIKSEDRAQFFSGEEHYHMLSVPFNVGLEYRLKYLLKLRVFTGADAHYFYKIDKNLRGINLDTVSTYFFGAHAGIGVDISWVTFDLIFEYGLSDAHNIEDSKYNWLTFAVGCFF